MDLDVLWQSSLSNILLVFAYLGYKLLSRVAGSRCHYTSEHGLELHLPDPEESDHIPAINSFLQNRGLSMRIRNKDASVV